MNPLATNVSGSCGEKSSQLVLTSDTMTVTFTFINVSRRLSPLSAAHGDKMATGVEVPTAQESETK